MLLLSLFGLDVGWCCVCFTCLLYCCIVALCCAFNSVVRVAFLYCIVCVYGVALRLCDFCCLFVGFVCLFCWLICWLIVWVYTLLCLVIGRLVIVCLIIIRIRLLILTWFSGVCVLLDCVLFVLWLFGSVVSYSYVAAPDGCVLFIAYCLTFLFVCLVFGMMV